MKLKPLVLFGVITGAAFASGESVGWSSSGSVIALSGAVPRRAASATAYSSEPSREFPRVWDVPQGWNRARRKLEDGTFIEYYSGLDPSISARLYSWPAKPTDDHFVAQAKFVNSFETLTMLDTTSQKRKELLSTFWSFKDGEKQRPDSFITARVSRQGDRLMAAMVTVMRPEDADSKPMDAAKELLEKLEWTRPRSRLAWGRR